MEVRCGKCNKLFNVSDDRITGKGIKFACTRCGEYVKITKEDFESYRLSQPAISAFDMFEPKSTPTTPPSEPETARGEELPAPAAVFAESAFAAEPSPEAEGADFTKAGEHDFFKETSAAEPSGQVPTAETAPDNKPRTQTEPEKDRAISPEELLAEFKDQPSFAAVAAVSDKAGKAERLSQPAPEEQRAVTASPAVQESQTATPRRTGDVPAMEPKPALKPQTPVRPKLEPLPRQAVAPRPAAQPIIEPARSTATPASAPMPPKREAARMMTQGAGPSVIGASPAAPARSNKIVFIAVLLILGLLGSGAYWYLFVQKSAPTVPVSDSKLISTEGLLINNASATPEANGDLLISGEIENTTDTEKKDWYIVVDVLDATGATVGRIRSLNGRQIFTREDYDIMAKRGENVQEMKEAALKAYTASLPPKGKMPFEMHYLQPPVGMASFNATLQPEDRERLIKEIAKGAK